MSRFNLNIVRTKIPQNLLQENGVHIHTHILHVTARLHHFDVQDNPPISFKKRRHPSIAAAEQGLSKNQSDNLKWQQDSVHQILNLMGLCEEGIVPANEVSSFRTHLLETLSASPTNHEPPLILRDKLIFLQVS